MRRCTWIMVGLLVLVMEARSEVVVAYNGGAPSGNVSNQLDNSAGVTFTTSGSSTKNPPFIQPASDWFFSPK